MSIIHIIFGLMFSVTGYLFAKGKIHQYLTPWEKMPENEKAKIDIVPLCKNIGLIIFLAGAIFLAGGMWEQFREHLFVIAMVIWIVIAGIDLYCIESKHWYEIS